MSKIESSMDDMQDAMNAMAMLLKSVKDGLDATLTSSNFSQSSLDQYSSTIQNDITSITNSNNTLDNQIDAITTAYNTFTGSQTSLKVAQLQLADLLAGASAEDIAKAREDVTLKEQSLADA